MSKETLFNEVRTANRNYLNCLEAGADGKTQTLMLKICKGYMDTVALNGWSLDYKEWCRK